MSKVLVSNIMQGLVMEILGPDEGAKAIQYFEAKGGFESFGEDDEDEVVVERLEKTYPTFCGFGLAALAINSYNKKKVKDKFMDMTIGEIMPIMTVSKNLTGAFWTTLRGMFKLDSGTVGVRCRNGSVLITHNPKREGSGAGL